MGEVEIRRVVIAIVIKVLKGRWVVKVGAIRLRIRRSARKDHRGVFSRQRGLRGGRRGRNRFRRNVRLALLQDLNVSGRVMLGGGAAFGSTFWLCFGTLLGGGGGGLGDA